jgi:hypothetical protein
LIFLPSKARGVNAANVAGTGSANDAGSKLRSRAVPSVNNAALSWGGTAAIPKPPGRRQFAIDLGLLKRPIGRLFVEHQGVGQQMDQIGKRDQLLVGASPVARKFESAT